MTEIKLDACERCGSERAGLYLGEDRNGRRLWRVKCPECGNMGAGFFEDLGISGFDAARDIVVCQDMAVKAWNR